MNVLLLVPIHVLMRVLVVVFVRECVSNRAGDCVWLCLCLWLCVFCLCLCL